MTEHKTNTNINGSKTCAHPLTASGTFEKTRSHFEWRGSSRSYVQRNVLVYGCCDLSLSMCIVCLWLFSVLVCVLCVS